MLAASSDGIDARLKCHEPSCRRCAHRGGNQRPLKRCLRALCKGTNQQARSPGGCERRREMSMSELSGNQVNASAIGHGVGSLTIGRFSFRSHQATRSRLRSFSIQEKRLIRSSVQVV